MLRPTRLAGEARVTNGDNPDPEREEKMFQEAMTHVAPMSGAERRKKTTARSLPLIPQGEDDTEGIKQLRKLVETGEGFDITQTAEYIDGTGYNVKKGIAKRLHQGVYAMEEYIDLHGLNVEEAKEKFDDFLREAVRTGKRGVLIVHGRGLSSPEEPVLKTKVVEWLTRGVWRKRLLAYASARPCDGGTGATYLLLRRQPYTKRLKKSSERQ